MINNSMNGSELHIIRQKKDCTFRLYALYLETQFPIKHKILQNSRSFRFILATTRFPVEKHEDESGAWQQRVKLPVTVATRAKSPRFQSSASEIENVSKVCQPFCFLEQKVQQACQACRFRNWESIKHRFRVFQVYRFQNWYQSNTP